MKELHGYIINSNFSGMQIEKEPVEFDIDVNQHSALLVFSRKLLVYADDIFHHKISSLFLIDSNKEKITLLECYPHYKSESKITLSFETLIFGCHIEQVKYIKPCSASFEIGSFPVPLLKYHLPQGKFNLECVELEIHPHIDDKKGNNIDLIITPIRKNLGVEEIEDVFFKLQDIFFYALDFIHI